MRAHDGDFVFRTLIAEHKDPATASRALKAFQAEVLREAARVLEATGRDDDAVNLMDLLADAATPPDSGN